MGKLTLGPICQMWLAELNTSSTVALSKPAAPVTVIRGKNAATATPMRALAAASSRSASATSGRRSSSAEGSPAGTRGGLTRPGRAWRSGTRWRAGRRASPARSPFPRGCGAPWRGRPGCWRVRTCRAPRRVRSSDRRWRRSCAMPSASWRTLMVRSMTVISVSIARTLKYSFATFAVTLRPMFSKSASTAWRSARAAAVVAAHAAEEVDFPVQVHGMRKRRRCA